MEEPAIEQRVRELLRFTKAHNSHREAITKATGENFNIFRVLGVGHLEVKTHSPILADLLNPKGSHGQGNVFLDLFLKHFKIDGFDSKTASAISELHIGSVTPTSGGRIDIVIQEAEKGGKTKKILIENKIYAGDQENQLLRYRNYDKKAPLFYLTLFGDKPSNAEQEEVEYQCISYEKDILSWLIACRKESACLPGVREVISQYITLIEELTYQSTTFKMNRELIEYILDDRQNFKAFQTLREADHAVTTYLIEKLDDQLDKIADEIGLIRDGKLGDMGNPPDAEFCFSMPCLDRQNLYISFVFEMSNFRDLGYGFFNRKSDIRCPYEDQLREGLKGFPLDPKPNEMWPAFAYFEDPYRFWGNDAFEGIRSGELAALIKQKLEIMAGIANQISPKERDAS